MKVVAMWDDTLLIWKIVHLSDFENVIETFEGFPYNKNVPEIIKNKMKNIEQMEEPTPCIHCNEWFDLQDGYESEKWHPNVTICEKCNGEEMIEISIDEEIEDLKSNLSDAEDNVVRYRKRLRELGTALSDSKSEKWDKLEEKISAYYVDGTDDTEDNEYDDGLIGIGEAAAKAFGYL